MKKDNRKYKSFIVAILGALSATFLGTDLMQSSAWAQPQRPVVALQQGEKIPASTMLLLVKLQFNRSGEATIKDAYPKSGRYRATTQDGPKTYSLSLFDAQGRQIGSSYRFPLPSFSEEVEGQGTRELNEATDVVVIPFSVRARTVIAKSFTGQQLDTLSVKHLQNLCGNGICDDTENHSSCAADCPRSLADGHCDRDLPGQSDGHCDPDCVAIAPNNDPFRLDPIDCGLTNVPSRCDGTTFCHQNQMMTCYWTPEMDPSGMPTRKVFQLVQACPTQFPCVDGYCGGPIDHIDGYLCRNSSDCVVNGMRWACDCQVCRRPGTFTEARCCNNNEDLDG